MTRINCIPVEELTRQHLVAEYRELPRVFALAAAAFARGEHPLSMPHAYTLGKGHVRFFYARLGYAARRHRELVAEMRRRGYKPAFEDVPMAAAMPPWDWHADWEPDEAAMAINRARIAERLAA